jgi:hypothetical protein
LRREKPAQFAGFHGGINPSEEIRLRNRATNTPVAAFYVPEAFIFETD